ncbi:hypothetical protein GBA52_021686 [Prunus armeniaca]|nr:hypothetical protein GBA52_021686 [Prunus armeniaca]
MLSTVTSLHLPPLNHTDSHAHRPNSQNLTTHLLHNFSSPLELKQLHAHLIKTNTPLTSLPLTRIAFVCSLNPSFSYAQKIFKHLENPEILAWNSCLKAFAEGKDPIDAVMLFYQLQSFHVLPDSFTLSFVLKACTRLLDVSNGRVLHGYVEKLGFQSNLFLMNMILNLYALCGEVRDARLLFDKMSQRDVVTWNIMMTQLVKRGDIKEAYDLFSRMPERSVRSWTLMISGFVQCGKPKEAISLFLEMEEAGVRPNEVTVVAVLAACADLGDLGLGRRIHEYSNQTQEIFQMWEKLVEKMKLKGYVPNTSVVLLDMEEDQKEKFLYRHSEKLALVFGLMNTGPGTPIRILKNLRVCEDCHAAFKLISAIVNREIVVRDRNRFHCFKDGSCSCRDYW